MKLPIPANIKKYAKAVVAVAALVGIVAQQVSTGEFNLDPIFAALGALGVYFVRNS